MGEQASSKLSLKELGNLYDRFVNSHQDFFNRAIWVPFPLEPPLSSAVQENLRRILQKVHRQKEYPYWLEIIFGPEKRNAIITFQRDLLRLALEMKRGKVKKKSEKLKALYKKYCFIPCYDVCDSPWDYADFAVQLKELTNKKIEDCQQEYQKFKTVFAQRKRLFKEFLSNFPLTKKQRELCIMAHQLVFIKDERDDYRRLGCYLIRPLFAEIGRRLGLSIKETTYLTIDETKEFLQNGKEPSLGRIKERINGYVLLLKKGMPLKVASGQEIKKVLKEEGLFTARQIKKEKIIKGVVGSKGKAKGEVVIVRTTHNLRQVTQGQIMVAVTTNPDYVPAMKKCQAIVTDEGGITSHAAIVSRELGIPCIVGTKIAMQVLKDGDLVEVDAEKGVVIKL